MPIGVLKLSRYKLRLSKHKLGLRTADDLGETVDSWLIWLRVVAEWWLILLQVTINGLAHEGPGMGEEYAIGAAAQLLGPGLPSVPVGLSCCGDWIRPSYY